MSKIKYLTIVGEQKTEYQYEKQRVVPYLFGLRTKIIGGMAYEIINGKKEYCNYATRRYLDGYYNLGEDGYLYEKSYVGAYRLHGATNYYFNDEEELKDILNSLTSGNKFLTVVDLRDKAYSPCIKTKVMYQGNCIQCNKIFSDDDTNCYLDEKELRHEMEQHGWSLDDNVYICPDCVSSKYRNKK